MAAWSRADIIALAAVIAIVSAFVEVALLGVAHFGLGRWTHLNPQIVWLAPLTLLVVAVVFAALILAVRPRTRDAIRAVAFATAWIGGTGVLFTHQQLHRIAAIVVAAGVAVQFSAVVVRHPDLLLRWTRRMAVPLSIGVVLAFAVLNGRWWLMERQALVALPPATDGPNVLLVIWDAVRASRLSVYGHDRRTTPTLERMATEGVVFERAFSTAPWTTPAHASLFTGLYPPQLSVDWWTPLDDEPVVLAEMFAGQGYRTAGITANRFATSRESGLSRGFSHYDDYHVFSWGDVVNATAIGRTVAMPDNRRHALGIDKPLGHKDAYQVDREFLDWLDRDDDRPFFAFLNYFDAHGPYQPPAPFDTLWGPTLPDRDPWMATGRQYSERELQAEIDAYDGAITFLDHRLGLLLDQLDRRGILDNTIVIVSSDHGEEFGEHGVYTHGHSMYDGVLHVPLLIRWPAGVPAGRRAPAFVSIRDVPATLHDLLEFKSAAMPGASMASRWSDVGVRTPDTDTLVASVDRASGNPLHYPVSQHEIRVLYADPWKLIANGQTSVELYDVREDPGEVIDLADALPELSVILESALHRRLESWHGSPR
jgi:arylsulfatase A-like enzyme